MESFEIAIENADIVTAAADVLLLKYAQGFHGADEAVARLLAAKGLSRGLMQVAAGAHNQVQSLGGVASPVVLFLGTVGLNALSYRHIRDFAVRALTALEHREGIRRIACTIHGANIGLDEAESALSLVGGFVDAFQRGAGPKGLERITICELNPARARRLKDALSAGLSATNGVEKLESGWGFKVTRATGFVQATALASAGGPSPDQKPHAFVAMPFSAEFEDIFHFGIQSPVKAAGMLCERVDQSIYDGLIVQRILERIRTARVVIADLSGANPNVYLEVGYAWGCGRPTILLVKDLKELRFDVQGHRCLAYGNIRQLESLLARELAAVGQG